MSIRVTRGVILGAGVNNIHHNLAVHFIALGDLQLLPCSSRIAFDAGTPLVQEDVCRLRHRGHLAIDKLLTREAAATLSGQSNGTFRVSARTGRPTPGVHKI